MEWETLDSEQIEDIMSGRDPRPPIEVEGDPVVFPKKPDSDATNQDIESNTEKPVDTTP
jgi:cell division protease FtsH